MLDFRYMFFIVKVKDNRQLFQVHITPLSLPGSQPNVPFLQHFYLATRVNQKRHNEVIPYNDCFYKHMYEYKYIALLDIDEVIVPISNTTWREVMDLVLQKATSDKKQNSYCARNVYFLDDLIHSHGWFQDIPR